MGGEHVVRTEHREPAQARGVCLCGWVTPWATLAGSPVGAAGGVYVLPSGAWLAIAMATHIVAGK